MKKMKNERKQIITIALALTLTLTILITALPFTSAQEGKMKSYAFAAAIPRVVKLGDSALINCWTSPIPGTASTPGTVSSRYKTGYVLTLTKPDGNTDTLQLGTTYEDGTLFKNYAPNQIGSWSVSVYWPGDEYFLSSTSQPYTFEVAEESPYTPIPEIQKNLDEYWERPVNGEVRGMENYLSNWYTRQADYGRSSFNPYSTGPESSHVLWTTTNFEGGIIGGEWGDRPATLVYSWYDWANPIFMGKLYTAIDGVTKCIDMDTGEELWRKEIPGVSSTANLHLSLVPGSTDAANYRGLRPVLFAGTSGKVTLYRAIDGEVINTVTDSRVGITAAHGAYVYYTGGGYLTCWNPYIPGNLNASSRMYTWQEAIKQVYRVPLPEGVPPPVFFYKDVGICNKAMGAYNLTTGQLMWNSTTPDPESHTDRTNGFLWQVGQSASGAYGIAVQDGLLMMNNAIDQCTYAFNIYTGEQEWKTAPREYPQGTFISYQAAAGNGKFYIGAYDGHMYAYNLDDGSLAWKFSSGDAGTNTPTGTFPFWGGPAVVPGKVYAGTSEHSPTLPLQKGNKLYCIDDTTGEEIWSIAFGGGGSSIADGKLVVTNEYDGLIYCFARGPTETSVSIKNDVIEAGSSVLITGSVIDQSPATKQDDLAVRYPNGVPAVSEESMTAWMEYLYMMRPTPMDATGVPVTISYVDPNGNYYDIDTVTTDTEGFRLDWTPPEIEGVYQIIVSFDGTTSYWSSHTTTSILVGPAPEPIPTTTPIPAQQTDTYIAGSTIAILAGIAIAVFLILRKK